MSAIEKYNPSYDLLDAIGVGLFQKSFPGYRRDRSKIAVYDWGQVKLTDTQTYQFNRWAEQAWRCRKPWIWNWRGAGHRVQRRP